MRLNLARPSSRRRDRAPVLDTTRVVETPEGVELTLHVAGPVPRALAWVIDFLIRGVIYVVLAFTFSAMGKMGAGLLAMVVFLMEWWYPVLFEVHDHGRTPGKRALGLHVLHDNGTPVGWSASLVRNLLRAVDFLPLFYGLGLAAMLVNRDFKRLGDLAAGTVVVHAHDNGRYLRLPAVGPLMAPVPLSREEQRALLDFAGQLHARSGGVFDLTSGVLRRAWDFKAARLPQASHIPY